MINPIKIMNIGPKKLKFNPKSKVHPDALKRR